MSWQLAGAGVSPKESRPSTPADLNYDHDDRRTSLNPTPRPTPTSPHPLGQDSNTPISLTTTNSLQHPNSRRLGFFTDKLSNLSFSHSQSHIHLTQSQLTSSHRASPIPSGLLPPRSHSRADSTPRDPFSMANNASASNINKRHTSPSKVSSSAQFPNPLFDVIWLSSELQPATGRTYDARLASREMHLLGNLPHLPTHLPTSLAASPSTLYLLTTASSSALPNTSSGKDNSWGSLSYLASYDALNRSEDLNTLVRRHIHQSFRSHHPRHYQCWRTMYQN